MQGALLHKIQHSEPRATALDGVLPAQDLLERHRMSPSGSGRKQSHKERGDV
jgi:hypothetical protein